MPYYPVQEFDRDGSLISESSAWVAETAPAVDIQKLAADLQVITAAVDDLILNALTEA